MLLIRDKKKPNKEAFLIGEKGFEGLQQKFPNRYVIAGGKVTLTADKIEVTPIKQRRETPPKKRDK